MSRFTVFCSDNEKSNGQASTFGKGETIHLTTSSFNILSPKFTVESKSLY
jgi:hypothetical protein